MMNINEVKENKLRGIRARFGFTQEDIANELGITREIYNKKENGKLDFTKRELKKLVVFFKKLDDKINIEDLF